jgi:hypothetical protein
MRKLPFDSLRFGVEALKPAGRGNRQNKKKPDDLDLSSGKI